MSGTDTTAYGASWYAATMTSVAPRPALNTDLDVDVCVIGGGLAGLTTAREVARRGWSVALIETGRLACGASGRNTGFVLPGFAAEPDKLIARVGFEAARDLWTLSHAGLDYVRQTIEAEAGPAIDLQHGWLYVSKLEATDEFTKLADLLGRLGAQVELWTVDRLRAQLRSERYFQAIHYGRAFTIHPLNYALALAAAAERDGARIFENTPALAIDPAGVRKRVVTPAARLRADQVVLAGNVQISTLMPRIAATLVPITTYVITTVPLGPRLAEAVVYRGAVSDTDLADNHYRVVGGDRLMWSGRATVWPRDPQHYSRALSGDIRKTYPQLGEVAVDYAWAGTLGNTVHRMPQIGELGPGVWLVSGFGGHGLNTTAMAGNIIARAIVDGDDTWRRFAPFELIWAGGILGRAAVQMRVWAKRLGDALAERRARARRPADREETQAATDRSAEPESVAAVHDGTVEPKGADHKPDRAVAPDGARPEPGRALDAAVETAQRPEESSQTEVVNSGQSIVPEVSTAADKASIPGAGAASGRQKPPRKRSGRREPTNR